MRGIILTLALELLLLTGCQPEQHEQMAQQAESTAAGLKRLETAFASDTAKLAAKLAAPVIPAAEPARGLLEIILAASVALAALVAAWQRQQAQADRARANKKEAQVNALAAAVPPEQLAQAFLNASQKVNP